MNKFVFLFIVPFIFIYSTKSINAQDVYSLSSGEFIFSWAEAEQYGGEGIQSNVRFTMFFHAGHFWQFDITNNIGFFTGMGLRNVGLITDENINGTDYKIIRRTYNLGLPIAIKLGSFSDHLFVYGGAEYEMPFHYKEKYWSGAHDRSGSKTKYKEWFGNQTERFLPSVFAGIQFPGGVNVKFKYYLTDYLNNTFEHSDPVSDLRRYRKTQLMFLSLSWQFNTRNIKDMWESEEVIASR